jgi:hypothetical protein
MNVMRCAILKKVVINKYIYIYVHTHTHKHTTQAHADPSEGAQNRIAYLYTLIEENISIAFINCIF